MTANSADRPTDCKLSVAMVTFNHAKFVERAIESVLMQEAPFRFELVIGEDCSTDATGEIVRSYARRHPETIRVLPTPRNLGAAENFVRTVEACRGEYLALLDGDDYWTSPRKLGKQVAILDAEPSLSTCFHPVRLFWEDGAQGARTLYPPGRKARYTLGDLAPGCIIYTGSVVYRRSHFRGFPSWYVHAPCGDWPMAVFHAQRGDIAYLDEVMSHYRIHSGGAFYEARTNRGLVDVEINSRMSHLLGRHLGGKWEELFRRAMYRRYYGLAHVHADRREIQIAERYARHCIENCGFDPRVSWVEPFKIRFKLGAPDHYAKLQRISRRIRGR